jgi:hypothetical protein
MTDESGYRRPRTLAEYRDRSVAFLSPRGQEYLDSYVPDPADVFVVTPPKCGTTWMQQIVHGLRSGGSMGFDNINDVVPWIGLTPIDDPARADQQDWRPRAFKTHSTLDRVPRGARYIVVLRDPVDAAVSAYDFVGGVFFDDELVDLATYVLDHHVGEQVVTGHVLAAWPRREDDDVMIVCYEDMKADPTAAIDSVAEFLGVSVDGSTRQRVVEQSDVSFMRQHVAKFDDTALFDSFRHRLLLPPTQELTKVRTGTVGAGTQRVPPQIRQAIADDWRATVTPATGLDSYQELRQALADPTRI